jgi:hypothetical protein
VGVNEVDGACAIWCPWLRPGEQPQPATSPVDYDFDGRATQDLVPGHSYDWHVISHVDDPSVQSDPRAWAKIAIAAVHYSLTRSEVSILISITRRAPRISVLT